jgi:hypothetical protein
VWSEYPVEPSATYLWPQAAAAWQYYQNDNGPHGMHPRWEDPVVLRIRNLDQRNLAPDHEGLMDNFLENLDDYEENPAIKQWIEGWEAEHPYIEPEDVMDRAQKGYQYHIEMLREMPPEMRQEIARQVSSWGGGSVMHYGPIHPKHIDVGQAPMESFEDAYDKFEGPEYKGDPDDYQAYDDWIENVQDPAFDQWIQAHPYLDDDARENAAYYFDDPENDEFERYFQWNPLLNHPAHP